MSALPSPPARPILGHALAFRRDPLALLEAAAPLGPIVELRLLSRRLWLITRAELVEEILIARARQFRKSPLLRVLGRLVLGDALDTLDGEAWSARMKEVAPAFRKPRLDALAPVITAAAEKWAGAPAVDEDALLDLALRLQARLLLGVTLDDTAAARVAIRGALAGWSARVRFGLPTPDWVPVPHNLAMRRAMRPLRARVARAVDARRAHRGDDVASALLAAGLDGAALVDELTTMTFLGAHQVSLALAWTLQSLAQHPAAQARIAVEAAHTLDPAQLPFTAMVLEESLRLHPPFFLLVREAIADGELGGHRLPRGTTLAVSPWVMQRSPQHFDAPDEFRPERWLNARPPRGAHFPFGAGPRICVANALVRAQVITLVAALVRRATLALDGAPRPPRPDVTLGIAPPLGITVAARAPLATGDEARAIVRHTR